MTGGGIRFIFLMTCLGAATVFFFQKSALGSFQQIFLGFAAGVMIFAAGSMIYVVVEELISVAHLGEHSHADTLGVMAGLVMMVLDMALG